MPSRPPASGNAYLASRLPAVGGNFLDTRTYSGGGGEYTMTTQVTRVG